MNRLMLVVLTAGILTVSGSAQQNAATQPKQDAYPAESCPLHSEHTKQASDKRFLDINQRGTKAMGFDQTKTTHHFRSFENGGAIEVTVKTPADTADLEAIRNHLSKIDREGRVLTEGLTGNCSCRTQSDYAVTTAHSLRGSRRRRLAGRWWWC
jgi:hypothetical protein